MPKHTLVVATFLLSLASVSGETIGGPSLTARAVVDSATGDVTIFNGNFTIAGAQVTSFSFFNNDPTNHNWLTPVILSLQSGRTYQVTGVGQSVQNTGAGLQTHTFTVVSGSANIVNSSYTFGFWNGNLGTSTGNTGVVQFDGNGTGPGFGESCPAPNTPPCSVTTVTSGNTIVFANNYNSFPNSGNALASPNGRNYSIQFTSNGAAAPPPPPPPGTPAPSTLLLTLTGLAGAGALYLMNVRKRQT